MILKKIKKCFVISVVASLVFGTVSSSIVSASGNGLVDYGYGIDELGYLSEKNINTADYYDFIKNSGISLNDMKDILDNESSIDFSYLHELSRFMNSRWITFKYKDESKREIFYSFLNLVRMLHIDHENISKFHEMLKNNHAYLHDIWMIITWGLFDEQRENLSVEELEGYLKKLDFELCNSIFCNNFKDTGYEMCIYVMQKTGWKLEDIEYYLGEEYKGLDGLKCIVDLSLKYGYFEKFAAEAFKNSKIPFKEVRSVCNEICNTYQASFSDFINILGEYRELSCKDFIDIAKSAKKSGRSYFDEARSLFPKF